MFSHCKQGIVTLKRKERLSLGWIIGHGLEHEIYSRGELSLIVDTLGWEGLDG